MVFFKYILKIILIATRSQSPSHSPSCPRQGRLWAQWTPSWRGPWSRRRWRLSSPRSSASSCGPHRGPPISRPILWGGGEGSGSPGNRMRRGRGIERSPPPLRPASYFLWWSVTFPLNTLPNEPQPTNSIIPSPPNPPPNYLLIAPSPPTQNPIQHPPTIARPPFARGQPRGESNFFSSRPKQANFASSQIMWQGGGSFHNFIIHHSTTGFHNGAFRSHSPV